MRKVQNSYFHPVTVSPDGKTVVVYTVQLWKNNYTKKWCAIIWNQSHTKALAESHDLDNTRKAALTWATDWLDAKFPLPLPASNFKAIEKLGV